MQNQELIDYIKKVRKAGQNDEEIIKNLIDTNHEKDDIYDAYKYLIEKENCELSLEKTIPRYQWILIRTYLVIVLYTAKSWHIYRNTAKSRRIYLIHYLLYPILPEGISNLVLILSILIILIIIIAGLATGTLLEVMGLSKDQSIQATIQEQNETRNWKLCKNEKYKYQISYPLDWEIWRTGPPEMSVAKCGDVPEDLVIYKDAFLENSQGLGIEVSDPLRLKGTIYKGSTSIDEYFNKNVEFKRRWPILKEGVINGERAVWIQSYPDPIIMLFHNNNLFEIRGQNLDEQLLKDLLFTFKFN